MQNRKELARRPNNHDCYLPFLRRRCSTFCLSRNRSFKGTYVCSEIRRKQVKNGGRSIQDPRRTNTETVPICRLLSPRNATSLTKNHQFRFLSPPPLSRRRGNFSLPSYRNTNYHLIYANTLEQNRFPGSIKYEVTSLWVETQISTWPELLIDRSWPLSFGRTKEKTGGVSISRSFFARCDLLFLTNFCTATGRTYLIATSSKDLIFHCIPSHL